MSNIRSLPKLIVGISVWRINFTAETDQCEFANFSLFQKWKLEITQELWVQLCSNTALLKRTEKLFHTMFIIQRETAALSRKKFKKIKNLKKKLANFFSAERSDIPFPYCECVCFSVCFSASRWIFIFKRLYILYIFITWIQNRSDFVSGKETRKSKSFATSRDGSK